MLTHHPTKFPLLFSLMKCYACTDLWSFEPFNEATKRNEMWLFLRLSWLFLHRCHSFSFLLHHRKLSIAHQSALPPTSIPQLGVFCCDSPYIWNSRHFPLALEVPQDPSWSESFPQTVLVSLTVTLYNTSNTGCVLPLLPQDPPLVYYHFSLSILDFSLLPHHVWWLVLGWMSLWPLWYMKILEAIIAAL